MENQESDAQLELEQTRIMARAQVVAAFLAAAVPGILALFGPDRVDIGPLDVQLRDDTMAAEVGELRATVEAFATDPPTVPMSAPPDPPDLLAKDSVLAEDFVPPLQIAVDGDYELIDGHMLISGSRVTSPLIAQTWDSYEVWFLGLQLGDGRLQNLQITFQDRSGEPAATLQCLHAPRVAGIVNCHLHSPLSEAHSFLLVADNPFDIGVWVGEGRVRVYDAQGLRASAPAPEQAGFRFVLSGELALDGWYAARLH